MNNITIIDFYIKKYKTSKFENLSKLNFLENINLDYYELTKLTPTILFKLFYACFSDVKMEIIDKMFDSISQYLDRINDTHYEDLELLYLLNKMLIHNNVIDKYYIVIGDEERMQEQFDELYFDKDIELFLKEIFKTKKDKFDFEAYNNFYKLCNTSKKLAILKAIIDILKIKSCDLSFSMESGDRKFVDKVVKENFSTLLNHINSMQYTKNSIIRENTKFENKNIKRLSILEKVKEDMINGNAIDTKNISKYFDDKYLIAIIINYNHQFKVKEYEKIKEENTRLKAKTIANKDILLDKYKVNIDKDKILVDDFILESKLKSISDYLNSLKKYSNIMLYLINDIDNDSFINIIDLVKKHIIDDKFILFNINKLIKKDILSVFLENINLFKKLKINISNIILYGSDILFMNNSILYKILNKYINIYNINLQGDIFNFEFLKKDYSHIIDKYIEIGEYELIKNNPSLINDNSDMIIKRCIFNKKVNEPVVNEQGKLLGSLRKESSYILSDQELNESILENYEDLIPVDVLEELNNKDITNFDMLELSLINEYLVNYYFYDINGFIVSSKKVNRCMKILLNSKYKDLYSYNELLLYSIIYNYPKLITRNNLNMLKDLLKIKTKTLKPN